MKYYTISEIAEFTGENKETLKKMCQKNKIEGAIKKANVWMIPRSYVSGGQIKYAGLYIDGANLLHGAIDTGVKIDYLKIIKFVTRMYNISVASFYDSLGYELDSSGKAKVDKKGEYIPKKSQLSFFKHLKGMGYRVVHKPLKYILGDQNKPKNNMDIPISLDIMKELSKWDTLILFSGDCDYERLIEDVVAEKKDVRIFSFKKRLSYELRLLAINSPHVTTTEIDDLGDIFKMTS